MQKWKHCTDLQGKAVAETASKSRTKQNKNLLSFNPKYPSLIQVHLVNLCFPFSNPFVSAVPSLEFILFPDQELWCKGLGEAENRDNTAGDLQN